MKLKFVVGLLAVTALLLAFLALLNVTQASALSVITPKVVPCSIPLYSSKTHQLVKYCLDYAHTTPSSPASSQGWHTGYNLNGFTPSMLCANEATKDFYNGGAVGQTFAYSTNSTASARVSFKVGSDFASAYHKSVHLTLNDSLTVTHTSNITVPSYRHYQLVVGSLEDRSDWTLHNFMENDQNFEVFNPNGNYCYGSVDNGSYGK